MEAIAICGYGGLSVRELERFTIVCQNLHSTASRVVLGSIALSYAQGQSTKAIQRQIYTEAHTKK